MKMSALVYEQKNKKRGILKRREPTNEDEMVHPYTRGKVGARTNYVSGQTPADRRAKFNPHVLIRQTSDGGNRNQNGVKDTARFSEGILGPEGVIKDAEKMEASNKQRDIDYVFVFTLNKYYELEKSDTITLNISKYAMERQQLERTRDRDAYMPTETDILTKCEQVLTELKTKDKIDVKAGKSTLSIGKDQMTLVERLKEHLLTLIGLEKTVSSSVKLATVASDKRRLSTQTTLIF